MSGILAEYLGYRKGNETDYLFCDSYGNGITKRSLQSSIQNYNNSRGVQRTSIHLFRHTFAKKWILNGGDVFRLQKMLGHSSLDVVKEYVNMFNADLQNQFENFNPLDRITKETVNKNSRLKMK